MKETGRPLTTVRSTFVQSSPEALSTMAQPSRVGIAGVGQGEAVAGLPDGGGDQVAGCELAGGGAVDEDGGFCPWSGTGRWRQGASTNCCCSLASVSLRPWAASRSMRRISPEVGEEREFLTLALLGQRREAAADDDAAEGGSAVFEFDVGAPPAIEQLDEGHLLPDLDALAGAFPLQGFAEL
ncbi:MAG: hypothetical protein QM757_36435 [Paludibaculum sp.]